uniref:Pyrrolo-quinoline quinone repeat domain-containing protein n=1 Tax=Schlesneria paludicola TaxID=360056 RepID=A0A7C4LNV7_9PLAN
MNAMTTPSGLDHSAARQRGAWCLSVAFRNGATLPLRNSVLTDGQGRLVAAVQDTVVCLVDETDGVRVVWEYRTGGPIPGSPAAAPDGSLRVHSADGRLHGLSPHGQPLWAPVAVDKPLNWATPLVDADGNTWLCAYSGGLIRVDANGSPPRRVLRGPTKFDATGVLLGGRLIVGGEDHFVHAIDLTSDRGVEAWDPAAGRGRTQWFVNSAAALTEGPVCVVVSRDEHVYGFSVDGEELWKTKLPGQVLGSPVIDAQRRVLVGITRKRATTAEPEGALACWDLARNQWLWEYAAEGPVESTPVVGSDGVIYFGDNRGWIHAVDPQGILRWKQYVGTAVRSAGSLVCEGRLVFGDDAGRLLALHCDSPAWSEGWPKFQGPARWKAPAELSTQPPRSHGKRIRLEIPFHCPAGPPPNPPRGEKVAPKDHAAARVGRASPAAASPRNDFRRTPRAPTVSSGNLSAVIDYVTKADLLRAEHHVWRIAARATRELRPLRLRNAGPERLIVSVVTRGNGLKASPAVPLRIPSGQERWLLLELQPDAQEWCGLEFIMNVVGNRRRIRMWIHRTVESSWGSPK